MRLKYKFTMLNHLAWNEIIKRTKSLKSKWLWSAKLCSKNSDNKDKSNKEFIHSWKSVYGPLQW